MAINTARPRLAVSPPTLAPLPFGLLSVATEVVRDDPHAMLGVLYEPAAGVTGGIQTIDGAGAVGGAMVPETFDGSTQPGSFPTIFTNPFLIYAGVQAHPVGHSVEEIQARASAKLALNAERWIEYGLYSGASGGHQLTAAATTVLAGTAAAPTAVSVAVGVGLLEAWTGNAVGAVGLLHAPRVAAGSLWNQVHQAGPKMLTTLGTPVAFGAAYDGTGPAGAPAPAAGTAWLYATGPVLVNRSATQLREVPAGQKTSFAQQVPLSTTFATEIVSVGYEAGCAAVLVTL